MSQESLDFGRLYRVTDATRSVYRALNDAVDVLGVLPAAGACGIDRTDLRRALDRDGRRLAVEHAMSIAAMSTIPFREKIARAFVTPLDFELGDARPQMTAEERALRYEAKLRSIASAVGRDPNEIINEALGSRR
jgi:hypothetical protein